VVYRNSLFCIYKWQLYPINHHKNKFYKYETKFHVSIIFHHFFLGLYDLVPDLRLVMMIAPLSLKNDIITFFWHI